MSKTLKDNRYVITARRGPATGLRAGGVMTSANRKRDAKRERHAVRAALRRGDDA